MTRIREEEEDQDVETDKYHMQVCYRCMGGKETRSLKISKKRVNE